MKGAGQRELSYISKWQQFNMVACHAGSLFIPDCKIEYIILRKYNYNRQLHISIHIITKHTKTCPCAYTNAPVHALHIIYAQTFTHTHIHTPVYTRTHMCVHAYQQIDNKSMMAIMNDPVTFC